MRAYENTPTGDTHVLDDNRNVFHTTVLYSAALGILAGEFQITSKVNLYGYNKYN